MPVLDALQAKREPNASSLVFFYKPGKRGEVPGAFGEGQVQEQSCQA